MEWTPVLAKVQGSGLNFLFTPLLGTQDAECKSKNLPANERK